MAAITMGVWSLFPIVWMLSWLRLVTASQAQMLWGIADYLAKVVFSSHLWQKNFVTIEDRKVRVLGVWLSLINGVGLKISVLGSSEVVCSTE
jgi:hypothetical protein